MSKTKKWLPRAAKQAKAADDFGSGRKEHCGHRLEGYLIEFYDEFAEEMGDLTGHTHSPAQALKIMLDYVLRRIVLDGVSIEKIARDSRRGL